MFVCFALSMFSFGVSWLPYCLNVLATYWFLGLLASVLLPEWGPVSFLYSILYTRHTSTKTSIPPDWGPVSVHNGGLSIFYTAAIYKVIKSRPLLLQSWGLPLLSVQLLYTSHMENQSPLAE